MLSEAEQAGLKEGLVLELGLEEGQLQEPEYAKTTPKIARETVRSAAIAVAAAAVVILLYVTFAFRKMPQAQLADPG